MIGDVLGPSNGNYLRSVNPLGVVTCPAGTIYGFSSILMDGRAIANGVCTVIGNITEGDAKFNTVEVCDNPALEMDFPAKVKICGNSCSTTPPLLAFYDENYTAPLAQIGLFCLNGTAKPFFAMNAAWDAATQTIKTVKPNVSGVFVWDAFRDGDLWFTSIGANASVNQTTAFNVSMLRLQPDLVTSFQPLQVGPDEASQVIGQSVGIRVNVPGSGVGYIGLFTAYAPARSIYPQYQQLLNPDTGDVANLYQAFQGDDGQQTASDPSLMPAQV